MFPCGIKRLTYSSQRHTGGLSFAQIIKAGDSHVIRNTNAAFLKGIQRAISHTVIRCDHGLEAELALIEQSTDCTPPTLRCVIALYYKVLVKTQVVCLEFIFIGLKALLCIDLPFNAANKSNTLIPMF